MLTCRLEAALSYTLPVDTIFTIAFTTFCKQLGEILCVHSLAHVSEYTCSSHNDEYRYAETSCNL